MLSKVLAYVAKNVGDRLELAADADMAWWKSLTQKQQENYLALHPKSRHSKSFKENMKGKKPVGKVGTKTPVKPASKSKIAPVTKPKVSSDASKQERITRYTDRLAKYAESIQRIKARAKQISAKQAEATNRYYEKQLDHDARACYLMLEVIKERQASTKMKIARIKNSK